MNLILKKSKNKEFTLVVGRSLDRTTPKLLLQIKTKVCYFKWTKEKMKFTNSL